MNHKVAHQYLRPRTLIHPGPFDPVRIHSLHAQASRHVRLSLLPGLTLFDALTRPLAAMGIANASMTVLGGAFDSFQFCVAPPDPTGQAVIAYGAPISTGATCMIFGNATLGTSTDRRPLVHCHATFRTELGEVKGGHVIAQRCIVGPDPIPVLVTSLDGFALHQEYDPETNIALLKPRREAPDA